MNNQIKILQLFIENLQQTFTINQISKELSINYRIAFEETKKLEKENLIKISKIGNANHCSFKYNFNEKIFAAETIRKNKLLKNKNLKVLYNKLSGINQQFILLLFGSYVKKTHTKHSDIDLLLITNNKKPIEQELELLPLKIHLTSITYKDFMIMLKTKEITVVSEAIKKNIILFGIGDYYRLLKNAE